jgi:ABC-type polysaccharide/polyol phosphate transport system ATPase subunit
MTGSPLPVLAADATVTFGSESYTSRSGSSFPVGIYLRSEETIGDYYVEIKYDNLRLQYIEGTSEADEENGILILQGNGNRKEVKYWIRFQAISGGEAELSVQNAQISPQDSDTGELLTLTELGSAPVTISGEDTAAEEEARIAEEEARIAAEEAAAAEEEVNRQEAQAQQTVIDAEAEKQEQEEAGDAKSANRTDGFGIFFNIYVFFGIMVFFLIVVVELVLWLALRARRKKRRVEIRQKRENVEVENLNAPEELEQSVTLNLKNEVTALLHNEQMEAELGKPVIVVDDVTMEFHLSSSNPSGLKEYLIQLLKREVTYRKLYALYHVSFKVYRGEIVGIIGTNGSGKSTLLKIISGALKPTGGHVEVDRRKIQLLTLGTGFDMELTARENVYLNGSIIGYSKEFLDRHYEEIVAFAELSDFMEEKVKNFSSGMVSRLGFAIATAGEAAEILILDEVLSVGDEFFKKKSLKRVKEMIHGGSTVLMVSHGMDTILQNCTKCVWIEKGELRMIGEPKVVCGEYQRLSCQ